MAKSASVGTKLKVGTGSSAKVVGGLTAINGVEITADTIDVTDLGNSSGYREKVAGFKDAGEVTCSGFFDGSDDGQQQLNTLLASGASSSFEILFPTSIGMHWTFTGAVVGISTSADVDNAVTFDVTIAVSGAPTLEAVSSSGSGG